MASPYYTDYPERAAETNDRRRRPPLAWSGARVANTSLARSGSSSR